MKPAIHLLIGAVAVCVLDLGLTQAADTALVAQGEDWRYRKGTNEPPADWHTVADAALDGTWLTGPGGFGFGDGDDATVLSDMQGAGGYLTVYTRRSFEVASAPPAEARLRLEVDYDDAYVAYLDGQEVARSPNVPSTPHPYNAGVATDHAASVEGGAIAVTDLGWASAWLSPGTHTLAVQGINGDIGSSDLSLIVDLWLETPDAPPGTNTVSGTIVADTSWHATNSPYRVTGAVVVAEGATLTIEAGVTVQFSPGMGMTVNGRLLALGTGEAPITFTRSGSSGAWERLLFVQAEPSRLRHCVIEYARCVGDHKVYYDDDNNLATPPPSRTYYQAVVAVASHLDIEDCVFQNLTDGGSLREGDAIAIISDDPDAPGDATAHIRACRFTGIGQGIHTRYSAVVVEDCHFSGHTGDNDDIDLYGESIPPSLIRNNRLVSPGSDDLINPTRCSAIMVGNVFAGAPDAGVVLRDVGFPVFMNNLVYNCGGYGVSVQNRCEATLINNTFFNCGNAIEFRDHETRHGYPYFLANGSGRATVINTVIWNCPRTFYLKDSTWAVDRGSHARVYHSNVDGGLAKVSVSAQSTLTWGTNNLNANPAFTNQAGGNFRLTSASPCIDMGSNIVSITIPITNLHGMTTNWTVVIPRFDHDGLSRPLDGNGDGVPVLDIGAFEYLRPDADSNGDGVPDGWYHGFGLDMTDAAVAGSNPDGDRHTTSEEWVADTDPTDPASAFAISDVVPGAGATVQFQSSADRVYTLLRATAVGPGGAGISWTEVPGQIAVPGAGGAQTLTDPAGEPTALYRVRVEVP